jgi:P-type Cu2+ transporter
VAKVFTFSVPGVKCAACVSPIENATLKCKKVKALDVYVDIIDKKVSVEVDDSPLSEQAVKKALVEAIEDIGYECKELKPPYHTIKGIIGILAGSVLLGLCISGLAIPFIGMLGIGLFSSFLTFYLGKETYIDAFKKIRHGYITMDTLFSISTLVALGVSLAGFFIPSLPMMYDAALLIFGFRHIGKAVEESAKTKIRNGLNFRSLAPKEVTTEGLPSKKPVEAVTPGEVITLYPGEVIPLDGICLDQQSSIFNTIQTGLASPQLLKKDDIILAGFKVPPHVVSIRMKVTANEQNSFLAKLDRDLVRKY